MKIKYLELKHYKKFKHADIRSLKWEIDNPIQIIIGSNGSGKSSLISQSLPMVPIKSEFKKGYKKQIIEHNNKQYILSADFKSNNKCHSFKIIENEKEEELNIGMGADIQKDLIEKHFNLNQYKLAILMFDLDWANMTPSIRKQYLYNLNPIDLNYINKVFKSTSKQLTKVNNNISLLHERKRKLKLSLLSTNEFKELQDTFKYISDLKYSIYSYMISFETLKENDNKKETINRNNIKIANLKNDIKNNISYIYNNSEIKLDIDNINKTKQNIELLNNKINVLSDNIKETISIKEKYELHLKHLSKKDKLNLLEDELKYKQKYINKNKPIKKILTKLCKTYTIEDLKSMYSNKSNILENFKLLSNDIFSFCNDHGIVNLKQSILPDTKINAIINKKNLIKDKCFKWALELDNLKKSQKELINRIDQYKKPDIPKDCISKKLNSSCSLFNNYNLALNNLNKKYTKVNNSIIEIKKKLTYYNKVFNKLSDLENRVVFFKNQLNRFINLMDNNILLVDCFKICFTYNDNISWFKNNINNINKYLLTIFKELYNVIYYYDIENEIKKILEQLNNIHQDLSLSVSFIEDQLKLKTQQLNKDQLSLKKYKNELDILNIAINKYNDFINHIDILKKYQKDLITYIDYNQHLSSKIFYNIVISETKQYLAYVTDKYNNIAKQIKDQEFLKERLQKEVLDIVNELYKKRNDLEKIQLVIKNLIASYNKNFLDKLVELSNFFLSSLCSYDFQLDKIENIENYDFKFKTNIGEFKLNDITLCSDGQKDLLRLSMNLALLIILDLKNYPIAIDEIDKTFDEIHKNKLLELLNYLINEKIVSQIFIVNHHAVFYDSFIGSYVVLNDANITCPEIYNTSIKIE